MWIDSVPHGLFDGCTEVPRVDVEDIDVVELHALERLVQALHHGLAVVAAVVGVLGIQ
jgi:hypothetical protein